MEARPCLFALQRVHKHGVRRLIGKNLTNKFSRKVSLNNVLGLFVSAILDFADSLEFVAWAFFGGMELLLSLLISNPSIDKSG